MIDLTTLNKNQREAVEWSEGPLLVLAGPGSGKTRVLTLRIARILEESKDEHFRLLALTFTNKAAAEMRNRVEELVPNALNRIRLTTFHSYAAELLQLHGSHLNIRPDFQILSNDADRVSLLSDVLSMLRRDSGIVLPEHFKAEQLLPAVTRLLERSVSTEAVQVFLENANVQNSVALSRVYCEYRKSLRQTNSLDFPSLIAECLDLLQRHPALIKHIRKVYKHILVDEFQDTNQSQYDILSKIVEPDPSSLFVVADDDQIIYQWNGANPKRIQSLRDEFDISELQLPENYRCPPDVIELANALIEKNLNRSAGKAPLIAVKPGEEGDVVQVYRFENVEAEAEWIASHIAKQETSYQQGCAIIARTKKLLTIAGTKLEEAGVSVYFASRKDEFKSAPFRMLHSILRLVNSKEDKQSLARLCKAFYELEGIKVEVAEVVSSASADGEDLLRTWLAAVKRRAELESHTRKLLDQGIRPLLSALNYRVFANNVVEWSKTCRSGMQEEDAAFSEFEDELLVWGQLQAEILKKFEGDEVSLHQFLQELDLVSKTPPRPADAIPCFTIHASKGMEFEHVFLMGLVEDQLPSWAAVKKGDESLEMQEERRNCFVAITRAQETLTLTFSSYAFGYHKKPSRFLTEMGIEV